MLQNTHNIIDAWDEASHEVFTTTTGLETLGQLLGVTFDPEDMPLVNGEPIYANADNLPQQNLIENQQQLVVDLNNPVIQIPEQINLSEPSISNSSFEEDSLMQDSLPQQNLIENQQQLVVDLNNPVIQIPEQINLPVVDLNNPVIQIPEQINLSEPSISNSSFEEDSLMQDSLPQQNLVENQQPLVVDLNDPIVQARIAEYKRLRDRFNEWYDILSQRIDTLLEYRDNFGHARFDRIWFDVCGTEFSEPLL